jgi:hypothetical protein
MNRLLITDKYPYVFTLIVAAVAFQFNYMVESAFEIPIIEYAFNTDQRDSLIGNKPYFHRSLIVSNISSNKMIGNLTIQLKYNNADGIDLDFPNMDPVPPARRMAGNDPMYRHNLLHYPIGSLQPGTSYKLQFFTSAKDQIPNIYYHNDSAALLKQRSFYTMLLRNHIAINFVIMLALVSTLAYYLVKLRTKKIIENDS